MVEIGDGDGPEADARAVLGYGTRDGALFRAARQTVGTVFHVAAGDGGAVGEQHGGADAEPAVGRVGVLGGCGGKYAQLCLLG